MVKEIRKKIDHQLVNDGLRKILKDLDITTLDACISLASSTNCLMAWLVERDEEDAFLSVYQDNNGGVLSGLSIAIRFNDMVKGCEDSPIDKAK